MTTTVFLVDFDETLMNTDRLRADLLEAIANLGKEGLDDTFHEAYEATRQEHGVPRIPLVLKAMVERYNLDFETHRQLADLFHKLPHQDYMYPGAEEAIAHLRTFGKAVLFSDGDVFFQLQKILATKPSTQVDGVVVLPNKINYFNDLIGYWPAEKYVFIDDKPKVLDAVKAYFGDKATTVLVKQGRYANPAEASTADMSVDSIAEVTNLTF